MSVSKDYFPKFQPFNGEPRPYQDEAIDKMFAALDSGKKYFVLAAPTGAGKSVILYAVAKAINDKLNQVESRGAMFTTSQKILQDQYEKDFQDMFLLKGRNNYPCEQPVSKDDQSTANGICLFKKSQHPVCWDRCPYRIAKFRAMEHPMVMTNFAYYITESNNVNSFGIRRVLVVDEAHNIENSVMSFVECTISDGLLRFCEVKGHPVPEYNSFTEYIPYLESLQAKVIKMIEDLDDQLEFEVTESEGKRSKRLKNLSGKIAFALFNARKAKWICDFDDDKRKVTFKPINVNPFVQSLVFKYADFIIMASATISKTYVRDCLGIPEEEFEFMEVPSSFPIRNRPILALNAGRMSFKDLNKTLPNIVRKVEYVLDQFPNQKGIIHATSYKIARYIEEHLGKDYRDRVISHNSQDRMEKLEEHLESSDPTVLLSPSMTEGVDLKDDLSRFQVIVKIPYASLADKQIKARMQEDNMWYKNLAAITLMQAYGRSVRSKDDKAITFVLDSSFKYFVSSNAQIFCDWFKEAIT